jgi:hypothetical protein
MIKKGSTYKSDNYLFFFSRSCPEHLEAGLTKVVLDETRNHYLNSSTQSMNDHATLALEADVADSPSMPLAAAGGKKEQRFAAGHICHRQSCSDYNVVLPLFISFC